MKNLILSMLCIACCYSFAFAQTTDKPSDKEIINKEELMKTRTYWTARIENQPPVLDGLLDDEAWDAVEWGTDFSVYMPGDGGTPQQRTAFKILYDDKNIYVGYRMYDTEPDKIERRMSRRDGFEGDWVEINFGSYNDKRTAFSFTTSVSGVKGDEFITNDGNNWDSSWDPIWYARTNIDEEGWTAEIRIPLSQLRYGNDEEQVWGLQVMRRLFRENERATWQYSNRNQSGYVSQYGELRGIKGIKSQKQVEIMPYGIAQVERSQVVEGDPYSTGKDSKLSVGVDGKIGITSDLTLDFTINPDFGQIEADPSVVVLDGFQVFFNERRPFFVENKNIFDFRITQAAAGGPFGSDNLFYSRRIGGSPHHYPNGDYVDQPQNTSILGAAKFSGKTKKGTSIGILESVTAKEMATITTNGAEDEMVVEPLTNYFVGRVQQDFNEGDSYLGGMFTATNRTDIDGTHLDYLKTSAYTGGIDFTHRWNKRAWYLRGNTVFSRVNGSREAITNTQRAFERLFQRPDADYVSVDTTLTSLVGHGGTIRIGENGGGNSKNFNFEGGVTWRSPGLELNDIGFMRQADDIVHFFWGGYNINEPFSIFNSWRVNYNHWFTWNFGGLNKNRSWNVNTHASFKNFWNIGVGTNINARNISQTALRGGPAMKMMTGENIWYYLSSDSRKKITGGLNGGRYWGAEKGNQSSWYSVWMAFQPYRWMNINFSPNYNLSDLELQYATSRDFNGEKRYINGTISQRTLGLSTRVNINVTPNLTLQYYGSPFISKGQYKDFKYITTPMADNFYDRFHTYTSDQITFSEDTYSVDEDKDGITDYSFGNPDFNFMQFRSNLVARWEYIPGSVLFFVWSQDNTVFGDPENGLMPSLRTELFGADNEPRNIFLVKWSYRFVK